MLKQIIISLVVVLLILLLGFSLQKTKIISNTIEYVNNEIINSPPELSIENEDNHCMEYMEISGKKIINKVEFNDCSSNKPSYCSDGKIISNCKLCGCDIGQECSSNNECADEKISKYIENLGVDGSGVGGSAGDVSGELAGGSSAELQEREKEAVTCTDSDFLNQPSPIYLDSSCTDTAGTYYDGCLDPITDEYSDIWIKEYKCKDVGGAVQCVGEYKSCSSNSLIYYGDDASICSSSACTIPQTCIDGVMNQDETGIDCGGACSACVAETCIDGVMNQDETGIDCGGACSACDEGSDEQEGEQQQEGGCYIGNIDEKGFTIFDDSICHDANGQYLNSCNDPVGDVSSDIFIKTYVCVNDQCIKKYYSCPVMGQQYYGSSGYTCFQGVCRT